MHHFAWKGPSVNMPYCWNRDIAQLPGNTFSDFPQSEDFIQQRSSIPTGPICLEVLAKVQSGSGEYCKLVPPALPSEDKEPNGIVRDGERTLPQLKQSVSPCLSMCRVIKNCPPCHEDFLKGKSIVAQVEGCQVE